MLNASIYEAKKKKKPTVPVSEPETKTTPVTKQAAMATISSKLQSLREKKAAEEARNIVSLHLSDIAAALPVEKRASIHRLQAELTAGKDISTAIKLAYPQMTGEQRGILTSELVRSAAEAFNKAAMATCGPSSTVVPAAKGGKALKQMSTGIGGRPEDLVKKASVASLAGAGIGATAGGLGGALVGGASGLGTGALATFIANRFMDKKKRMNLMNPVTMGLGGLGAAATGAQGAIGGGMLGHALGSMQGNRVG